MNNIFDNKVYKIAFSIPVHEKPEVVIDQITNLRFYNKNAVIVLHFSKTFDYHTVFFDVDRVDEIISGMEDVYINPTRLKTGAANIIQCHISNFRFLEKQVEFEYFVPCSSNELYMKSGMYKRICGFSWGCNIFPVSSDYKWEYKEVLYKDTDLKRMLNNLGVDIPMQGQIEGSYYKKELFRRICNIIEESYDYDNKGIIYPREEVYFCSVAYYIGDANRGDNVTYVNWNNNLEIYPRDIKNVSNDSNYYSIKRVKRKIYNPLRVYIRECIGDYYLIEKKIMPQLKKKKIVHGMYVLRCCFLSIKRKVYKVYSVVKK